MARNYIFVGDSGLPGNHCKGGSDDPDQFGSELIIRNDHPTRPINVTAQLVTTGNILPNPTKDPPFTQTVDAQTTFFVACSVHPVSQTFSQLNLIDAEWADGQQARGERRAR